MSIIEPHNKSFTLETVSERTAQEQTEDRSSSPSQNLKEQTLVASWLSQKKKDTTRRNYEREVKHFFSLFPNLMIKDISIGHLSLFLNERDHLSAASKRKSKDAISSLLTFCVKVGYIDRNPAHALDSIRVPDKTSFRILSEEQVLRMIEKTEKLRDLLVIKLLYYAGLRVSELCSLKWANFTPRTRGVQMTVIGKGRKVRSILIDEQMWAEILQMKEHNRRFLPLEDPDQAVFCSQKEPYNNVQPNQVRRIVMRAAKKAGLPQGVSPHWLRHCHATHALERGAPIHIVQKTLGHASLSTTGKYLDARPLDSSSRYLSISDSEEN